MPTCKYLNCFLSQKVLELLELTSTKFKVCSIKFVNAKALFMYFSNQKARLRTCSSSAECHLLIMHPKRFIYSTPNSYFLGSSQSNFL